MQKQREKRSTITLGFRKTKGEEASSVKISSSGMTLLEERQKFLRESQIRNSEQSFSRRSQTAGEAKSKEKTNVSGESKATSGEEIKVIALPSPVEENREDAGETAAIVPVPDRISSSPENKGDSNKNATKSARRSGSRDNPRGGSKTKIFDYRPGGRYQRGRDFRHREERNIYDASKKSETRKKFAEDNPDGDSGDRRNTADRNSGDSRSSSAEGKLDLKIFIADDSRNLNSTVTPKSNETFGSRKNVRNDSRSKTNKGSFEEGNLEKLDKKISKDKQEKYSKNIHTYIFNREDDENSKNNRDKYGNFRRKKRINTASTEYAPQKVLRSVNIPDFISVSDLADRMNEKKSSIIKKLLTMGVKATVNQTIDADTAELIVMEFGHAPNRVSDSDVENILSGGGGTKIITRNPIVTVMGHVDHGKTSLLDALRTTNIVESESGGITQHIGASRVNLTKDKFITFIDTPGHEAFTEMRIRGANITDIVILVVAADDGIKDQTIEAISHTKAAKVPMIVAINKIDRVGANSDKIKQDLLQYGIISTEFGGNVIFIDVSAKNKTNLDKLMEAILFQAELLDLKATIDCEASGTVIESKMDAQRGALTTLLVQRGTLNVGDIVLAGTNYGKIRKMVDDKKKILENAGPSMAIEILGLNGAPSAGMMFNVVSTEKEARDIISYRERKERETKNSRRTSGTMENILSQFKDGNRKQLSVILKTDVSGSTEAIAGSLMKLETGEIGVEIVHSAVGSITESDINLALMSNAIIVAFNVRASVALKDMAHEKNIKIKYYSIIYDIVNDIRSMMTGLLEPIEREKIIGQAEIRKIIKVTMAGKIAGCFVIDGEIHKNSNIHLIRNGIVIFDGKIKTLRRFKEDVREVKNNYECGISIENYDNIAEKDIIECYEKVMEKRV
ncbi:MAG: translation initiation factor IF-2 [Rickettsiales bacterium]|jgi:translation initiation factor IF-2|nr:translation initiation factor IF-2 [Rickettsiales bacterium]